MTLKPVSSENLFQKASRRFGLGTRIMRGRASGLKIFASQPEPRFYTGEYEEPIQSCIEAHLENGGVFYDIGANIGFFSILAARLVGPEGRVYAFEPVRSNVMRIRRAARANQMPWLDCMEAACSDAVGSSILHLTCHAGGSALECAPRPVDAIAQVPVATTTVDAFVGRNRPPTLMKIDVEGAELQVLRGARDTLRRCGPDLIVEADSAHEHAVDQQLRDIETYLSEFGYACERLQPAYDLASWSVAHLFARRRPG